MYLLNALTQDEQSWLIDDTPHEAQMAAMIMICWIKTWRNDTVIVV
jgi:hypothetical protein